MRISKKSRYGLRAMIELGLHHKEGALSAKSISKDQEIPLQYLEQIFNRLKKSGLVKTARGPKGGYRLSREPARIKIKDIIERLEDKNSLVECLVKKGKPACRRVDSCAARRFWDKLSKSITKVLDSTTLQDLCSSAKKAKGENNIKHHYMFQI
jgi:Rrf2 family protein